MPGRLQGTLLICPVGTAGVQGLALGITVDLSVLLYLLCPLPGPHRTGVPGLLVPVGSDCASRRRAVSRGSTHPRSERRARVGREHCFSLARSSGRRLDRPSGLSFRYLGRPRSYIVRNVVCWAELLLESRSIKYLGFMNPTPSIAGLMRLATAIVHLRSW